MVKADVRRDYYADLGLQPSVEAEDIKKQFRKLALQYHPDRNPGRENEFNAKFQAIQAANEILSDPQQRLKYDTDRLRAGYGKVYGPPKTNQRKTHPNSFASATPPPRTQPQKPPFATRSHTTTNGPSPGAQRYAPHARAGTQQWSKNQDNAQTRADAFRAFNGMRGSHAGGWRGFDPETGRATPSGGTPRQQPFGNPRSKSAYEYFKDNIKSQGSSSPNSSKKKTGFAPATPGGDEPMARNTSAYTNNRSERPSSMYFDSAPSPTAKKPAAPDMPPSTEEAKRFSTSYATAGGERTFFSSSGVGRSSNGRMPSGSSRASGTRTNAPNPASGQSARHRSASPKETRDRAYSLSTSSSELDETDEEVEEVPRPSAFKPKAVPKSRLRPTQNFSDFHGDEHSSSANGEESFTRKRTWPRPPSPRNGDQIPRRVPEVVDLTADSDDQKAHNSDSAAFPKGSYKSTSQGQSSQFGAQTGSGQNADSTKSAPFERHSSSELHKKFSAEKWQEDFHTFDFLGTTAKERASPSMQKRSSTTHRSDPAPSGGSNPPGSNTFASAPGAQTQAQQPQQAPTPFAQAKFSADQWAAKLQDISWNTQENDRARQAANTPPTRSSKKQTRGAKVRSVPQPASVANEAEEAQETINGNSPPEPSRAVPADSEAMDIDEPPVPPASAPPAPEKAATGTNYPDLKAHVPQATTNSHKTNVEARTPLFDLDNLRNTAPFTSTNNDGIENLEDVHATLPFESRAKQPTTSKRDLRPRELKLPNPPKRPRVPQPAPAYPGSTQLTLPRDKWNWYISAMGSYMYEWNAFNRRMLLHFNARQEAIETGLAPGWISAVGDTSKLRMNETEEEGSDKSATKDHVENTEHDDSLIPGSGKGGFGAYLQAIQEDNRVRKHWDVANEMHEECILELGQLRDWIRNGGKVV